MSALSLIQLTPSSFATAKAAYADAGRHRETRIELFESYLAHFKQYPQDLYTYRHTYTTWFVLLFMRLYGERPIEDIAWMYQHAALYLCLLDFDIVEPFFYYLGSKSNLSADQEAMYGVVQTGFLHPYGTFGVDKKGAMIPFKTAQQLLTRTLNKEGDTYARTEQLIVMSRELDHYYDPEAAGIPVTFIEPREAIDAYADMLGIFMDYEKDGASDLVFYHGKQDWFAETADSGRTVRRPAPATTQDLPPADAPAATQDLPADVVTPTTTPQAAPAVVSSTPAPTHDYASIKSYITTTFGDLTTLSPETIAPVLTYLDAEAERTSDDSIHSLVIFDAASGTFVWNSALLAE